VKQRWQIKKIRVELDANRCGEMIYRIETDGHDFHFVLFANNLSVKVLYKLDLAHIVRCGLRCLSRNMAALIRKLWSGHAEIAHHAFLIMSLIVWQHLPIP
jgi:hypothetical protein